MSYRRISNVLKKRLTGEQPSTQKSKARQSLRLFASVAAVAFVLASCSSDNEATSVADGATTGAFSDAQFDTVSTVMSDDVTAQEVKAVASSGEAFSPNSGAGANSSAIAPEIETAAPAGPADQTEPAAETEINPAQLNRQIVYTADLNVEVESVSLAETEAIKAVTGVGGFVFSQTSASNQPTTIVFKVVPEKFDAALASLDGVGEVRNRSIGADDVTERVVNLSTRIEVAEIGVERLKDSLRNTSDLSDFAEIERLLLQRETDLELMRGSLRTLEGQVSLATINLTLTEDGVRNSLNVEVSAYDRHDKGNACPGQTSLFVGSGDDVTVCFKVENRGDQTLTDIKITDPSLGITDETELITIFGTTETLPPGQELLLAYEFSPERPQTIRTSVKATPTNGITAEPTGPSIAGEDSFRLEMDEPQHRSGFGDGFEVGKNFIAGTWVVLKVLAGFLIPMLLVLIPLALLLRFIAGRLSIRRAARRTERAEKLKAAQQLGVMAPPPPVVYPTPSEDLDKDLDDGQAEETTE